jgi:tetratricopeptide (TPR) repeat protein
MSIFKAYLNAAFVPRRQRSPERAAKPVDHYSRRVWIWATVLLLWISNVAFAHGPGDDQSPLGVPAAGNEAGGTGMFVDEMLGRSLEAVRAMMEKNQFKEAAARLEALEARSDKYNRYENAILHQTLGYVYASMNDYAQAAESFEEALAFKALPKAAALAMMQNLGQLYIATEQYDKGITTLENWMGQAGHGDIPAQLRVLLGNAYLHKQDYAKAAAQLRQAVAGTQHPDKAWLQLLAATYQEWGHYAEAAEALQQGVALYPEEKTFWRQLAAAYRQLHDDNKAAAVLALSCNAGLCEAADIAYLAKLYLYLGAPDKSAGLLDAALRDGRMQGDEEDWLLLAQSWQQARELDKAEQGYIEAAKRATTSGTADFRLGQIYAQQEKWPAAAAALAESLKKGHLSSPGHAQLMLGVSHYYLGHTQQALTAVEAATHYSDVEKEARRWLQQLRATPMAARN